MGIESFKIFLKSPTGSYFPGSRVTGKVVLVLDKPKEVRGIKLKSKGFAKVSWDEGEGEASNTYKAKEEYFSYKYYLIGSENSLVKIPSGENVYPFSITLPSKLPSSFEGDHGYIRYTIKAILDRPWKIDEKTKIFITVLTPPVDLNLIPQVKEPVIAEASKTFCCLCCITGPLTLAGGMPYSGYVPGQTIVTTIAIDNASDVRCPYIKCKLMKKIKYIASKEKESTVTLVKYYLDEVCPKKSYLWTLNIKLPQMPVINLDACSIIEVHYYIELLAPGGFEKDLKITIPITLGTVPIDQGGGTGPAPTGPVLLTAPTSTED